MKTYEKGFYDLTPKPEDRLEEIFTELLDRFEALIDRIEMQLLETEGEA